MVKANSPARAARQNTTPDIIAEDARIVFRNFSGKGGQCNAEGDRNFCLLLSEEARADLEREGWNVKFLKPRQDEDEPQAYIEVRVSYRNIPPRVVLISGQGKTLLDEDTVSLLDFAEIKNVDVIVRPYHWEVNGKTGIKAYLKSMYVTIQEDEFASKYYDVPDSAATSLFLERGESDNA